MKIIQIFDCSWIFLNPDVNSVNYFDFRSRSHSQDIEIEFSFDHSMIIFIFVKKNKKNEFIHVTQKRVEIQEPIRIKNIQIN